MIQGRERNLPLNFFLVGVEGAVLWEVVWGGGGSGVKLQRRGLSPVLGGTAKILCGISSIRGELEGSWVVSWV